MLLARAEDPTANVAGELSDAMEHEGLDARGGGAIRTKGVIIEVTDNDNEAFGTWESPCGLHQILKLILVDLNRGIQ